MKKMKFIGSLHKKIANLIQDDKKKQANTSNVYIDGSISDLSVQKVTFDEYAQLVEDNACISNVIYVVDQPGLDGLCQRISNVGMPIDVDDAATKQYVDSQICSAISCLDIPPKIDLNSEEFKNAVNVQLKNVLSSLLIALK